MKVLLMLFNATVTWLSEPYLVAFNWLLPRLSFCRVGACRCGAMTSSSMVPGPTSRPQRLLGLLSIGSRSVLPRSPPHLCSWITKAGMITSGKDGSEPLYMSYLSLWGFQPKGNQHKHYSPTRFCRSSNLRLPPIDKVEIREKMIFGIAKVGPDTSP